MFQPISCVQLIPGETYRIKIKTQTYKGTYSECMINQFYKFINVKNVNVKCLHYDSLYFQDANFYIFVSQKTKIQNEMERRGVNKIIGTIIGDECFRWY